jgi:hypothetical protein
MPYKQLTTTLHFFKHYCYSNNNEMLKFLSHKSIFKMPDFTNVITDFQIDYEV